MENMFPFENLQENAVLYMNIMQADNTKLANGGGGVGVGCVGVSGLSVPSEITLISRITLLIPVPAFPDLSHFMYST